jgi:hypothetical protein
MLLWDVPDFSEMCIVQVMCMVLKSFCVLDFVLGYLAGVLCVVSIHLWGRIGRRKTWLPRHLPQW